MESPANIMVDQLRNRLGPKAVTTDLAEIEPWLVDWRKLYRGKAPAIISPASTAEVRVVVEMAAAASVPLVPQGGNTSMVGGATPQADGQSLILSLRRMNAIRMIDAPDAMIVAEAGVILANLHDAAARQAMRFPLTLGGKGSATVGGLVSTNAGGTQVLRFGTMRKLTLGLEAVLPDGSLHNGLAPLKKDNRGYDINQLLIGAEGTLGIVTAAALRLAPAIVDRAVGWVGVSSPHQALRLLRWLEARSGDCVEGFEILPQATLDLVVRHISGARAPLDSRHAWHVLIEFVVEQDPQGKLEALLGDAYASDLLESAAVSNSEAQANAFWRLRDSISEAERASGPAIQHDISVPVDAMPDFMTNTITIIEREYPGISASAFGHLGDGNVHFHVRAPHDTADATAWRIGPGKSASQRVYDLVVAENGSISAEHGIGQMKLDELVRLSDTARIAMMRAIKNALDPKAIMNPGKLVPLAPGACDA